MAITDAKTWTGTEWRSFHAVSGNPTGDTQMLDAGASWRSLNGQTNPTGNTRHIWDGTAWQPLDLYVNNPPVIAEIGVKKNGQSMLVPVIPPSTQVGDLILIVCFAPGQGTWTPYSGMPRIPAEIFQSSSTFNVHLAVFGIVADGIDTQYRIDTTANYATAYCIRVTGADTSNIAGYRNALNGNAQNAINRTAQQLANEQSANLYLYLCADSDSANGPYTPNAGWAVALYEDNVANYSSILIGRRVDPIDQQFGPWPNFTATVAANYNSFTIEIPS